MHQNHLAAYPNDKILEVSSSSTEAIGYWLSAMHLSKRTPEGLSSVETYFQKNRIYETADGTIIGPFPEFHSLSGKECLHPVVPQSVSRDQVISYFNEHFVHLSNSPKYIPQL